MNSHKHCRLTVRQTSSSAGAAVTNIWFIYSEGKLRFRWKTLFLGGLKTQEDLQECFTTHRADDTAPGIFIQRALGQTPWFCKCVSIQVSIFLERQWEQLELQAKWGKQRTSSSPIIVQQLEDLFPQIILQNEIIFIVSAQLRELLLRSKMPSKQTWNCLKINKCK